MYAIVILLNYPLPKGLRKLLKLKKEIAETSVLSRAFQVHAISQDVMQIKYE